MGDGPTPMLLQAFADTYLFESYRDPNHAMSAAAKAHNISRATANRWAQECRELGYIPSRYRSERSPASIDELFDKVNDMGQQLSEVQSKLLTLATFVQESAEAGQLICKYLISVSAKDGV